MIAKTILQQIGGRRFVAMTGSKDFIDMGNGLRMCLARNKTSANRLDIIYDAGLDLYNMRFYRRTFSKKTFECKTCLLYTSFYVWKLPDTSRRIADRYVVALDIGGRNPNADYSVISVIAVSYTHLDVYKRQKYTKTRNRPRHDVRNRPPAACRVRFRVLVYFVRQDFR